MFKWLPKIPLLFTPINVCFEGKSTDSLWNVTSFYTNVFKRVQTDENTGMSWTNPIFSLYFGFGRNCWLSDREGSSGVGHKHFFMLLSNSFFHHVMKKISFFTREAVSSDVASQSKSSPGFLPSSTSYCEDIFF